MTMEFPLASAIIQCRGATVPVMESATPVIWTVRSRAAAWSREAQSPRRNPVI